MGEEAGQCPKTHLCLAGCLRHSRVLREDLNPSFRGGEGREMKIATALHHSLSERCLLSCSARCAPPWGERRLCPFCPHLLLQHPALLAARTPQHMHNTEQLCLLVARFPPKIRFLLIMVTKAALQGNLAFELF